MTPSDIAKSTVAAWIRDRMLLLAIAAGIIGYFLYAAFDWAPATRVAVNRAVAIVQPTLIFAMLFITFCRIDARDIRPRRWHFLMLAIQGGVFGLLALALILVADMASAPRVIIEGAMLCMICPTATAAAVITRKLGGSVAHIVTYTLLINLLTAILIPTLVPLVHPQAGVGFVKAASMIMAKVFPLLLLPLVGAFALKAVAPRVCAWLGARQEVSFYLWATALTLAIAVTTRSVVHTHVGAATMLGLVAVSLFCCLIQFAIGRRLGNPSGDRIAGAQAMGQKNTVLAIWLGFTFFTPVTAIVGGFYSIWHNLINSRQLYRQAHPAPSPD